MVGVKIEVVMLIWCKDGGCYVKNVVDVEGMCLSFGCKMLFWSDEGRCFFFGFCNLVVSEIILDGYFVCELFLFEYFKFKGFVCGKLVGDVGVYDNLLFESFVIILSGKMFWIVVENGLM